MKVVFYSFSTTSYGAPTSLLNLIEGWTKFHPDIRIYVIVPGDGPLTVQLKKLGTTVIKLPFEKWVYNRALFDRKRKQNKVLARLWFFKNYWSKRFINYFWFPRHVEAIRKIGPDIIYTNSSLSPMGVMVARKLKIKSVWHHRETINDPLTNFFVEWQSQHASRILNSPDIHLYASLFLKEAYHPYIQKGKNIIVTNGVAAPGRRLSMRTGKRDYVIGMVGRINEQKGQRNVIEIIRRFPAMKLHLYGAGEKYYVDPLKSEAPANVSFAGFREKDLIYSEIDFLLVNARNESFGRVVAEAFGYGIPVIALNSGALPELVDENTGFLFNDEKDLVTVIESLSKISDESYSKISEQCLAKYRAKYSLEVYAANILEALETHD